jgi:hypothetical protein
MVAGAEDKDAEMHLTGLPRTSVILLPILDDY